MYGPIANGFSKPSRQAGRRKWHSLTPCLKRTDGKRGQGWGGWGGGARGEQARGSATRHEQDDRMKATGTFGGKDRSRARRERRRKEEEGLTPEGGEGQGRSHTSFFPPSLCPCLPFPATTAPGTNDGSSCTPTSSLLTIWRGREEGVEGKRMPFGSGRWHTHGIPYWRREPAWRGAGAGKERKVD